MTAYDRLTGGYYNSLAYDAATNPGGLGNGGHVVNFPAALDDLGTVAGLINATEALVAGGALARAGDTMTGRLTGVTPAAGAGGYASFRAPHGADPTTNLANGDIWTTTAGVRARINGATRTLATVDGAEALTNKTGLTVSDANASAVIVSVRNTTDGASAYGELRVGNSANATLTQLLSFAPSSTIGGAASHYPAGGSALLARGANGLSIVALDALGDVRLFAGAGAVGLTVKAAGGVDIPGAVTAGTVVAGNLTTSPDQSGVVTLGRFSAGVPSLVRCDSTSPGIQFRNFAGTALLELSATTGLVQAPGVIASASSIRAGLNTYANRPLSPSEGDTFNFTDSNTAAFGATIAGGGANHVSGRYNGSNWTVTGA